MGRPREEFWKSPLCQILEMIDMYIDEIKLQNAMINNEYYESKYYVEPQSEVREIKSMHEIEGW